MKDWVRGLCFKCKINFLSLQETKIELDSLFSIRNVSGNASFDFVCGPYVGRSGGILCIWDHNLFSEISVSIADYFVLIHGIWKPSGSRLLLISDYAP